jgi:hypothetical protein
MSSPSTQSSSGRARGAYTLGDGPPPQRRRRFGWLWPLALLLLAGVVALVLALTLGGEDDGKSHARKPNSASGGTSSGGGSATSASGAGGGRLIADGVKMLPVPSSGLKQFIAKQARGQDVTVLSRNRDARDRTQLDGFWVGSSRQDRVFVEWGGGVGPDEAKFLPKVGQHVNLEGPVRPAPRNPEKTLNLRPPNAQAVSRQGAYINADTVSPAK